MSNIINDQTFSIAHYLFKISHFKRNHVVDRMCITWSVVTWYNYPPLYLQQTKGCFDLNRLALFHAQAFEINTDHAPFEFPTPVLRPLAKLKIYKISRCWHLALPVLKEMVISLILFISETNLYHWFMSWLRYDASFILCISEKWCIIFLYISEKWCIIYPLYKWEMMHHLSFV